MQIGGTVLLQWDVPRHVEDEESSGALHLMGFDIHIPGVGWYAMSLWDLLALLVSAAVLIGTVITGVIAFFRRLTAAKSD